MSASLTAPGAYQRHTPSTNLDLWFYNYKGYVSFWVMKTELWSKGSSASNPRDWESWGCQDGKHKSHMSAGKAAKWGGQKWEEIRKGLWLVKVFSAFPASPACFMFKKLQLLSLPQPPCMNRDTLAAGGSRLHFIRQLKSNQCIFVLLPSHTWLSPTLMLLRGTQCTKVIY